MAYYKDDSKVSKASNDMFDVIHKPGDRTTYAGIYRCEGCGHEIGIAGGHTLPPEHPNHKGAPIQWRLLVWAVHKYD